MTASLLGTLGDLQLAEDTLQDAVERALVDWNHHGMPDAPAAWLLTTARRKAIDSIRRSARFARMQPALVQAIELELSQASTQPDDIAQASIPDKRLELMFTCAHPALDKKTRVALTLRTLGGLSTEEIARAFVDKPAAMAQRLVRARHKITAAGIAYEVPDAPRLSERLDGVLSVVYLIFNEGYASTRGHSVTRQNLCDEAIRLARILSGLMPQCTEVTGLLALMLLHDSRRESRSSDTGAFIPLERQNRKQWNTVKKAEGIALLKQALAMGEAGPYQLQAAISAVHAEAADWLSTDWTQIVALYEELHRRAPSPVVRLNRAVAVSYAQSPEKALQLLMSVGKDAAMQHYQPYRVARSDILWRAGQTQEAIDQLQAAIAITESRAELEFLHAKLAKLRHSMMG